MMPGFIFGHFHVLLCILYWFFRLNMISFLCIKFIKLFCRQTEAHYIIEIMWFFYFSAKSHHKTQSFNFPTMLCAGRHNIDSGSIYTAVSQKIRQFRYILFNSVKGAGKKFSQIVWKHLALFHPGSLTQLFHLKPNITPV